MMTTTVAACQNRSRLAVPPRDLMSISVSKIDNDPAALEKLPFAILEVHHGGTPMNSQIAPKIVEFLQKPPPLAPQSANLTPRQAQVLDPAML